METASPLGQFRASVDGRILVVEHTGPFNLEYWESLPRTVVPLIQQLETVGPYAIMIAFHADALMSLQGLEIMMERNRGFAQAHPLFSGIAVTADVDVHGRDILRSQVGRYFAAQGAKPANSGFFRDRDHAMDFLRDLVGARLASVTPSS